MDDYSIRISPDATLEDHEGELTWDLRYRPSYEYFIDTVQARGWDHQAWADLGWQINPTTRVDVSESVRSLPIGEPFQRGGHGGRR